MIYDDNRQDLGGEIARLVASRVWTICYFEPISITISMQWIGIGFFFVYQNYPYHAQIWSLRRERDIDSMQPKRLWLELCEEEAKNTTRRVFQNNPRLSSEVIGKAIGRSRRTVDSYIADLRAAIEMELNLKIFRMHYLGIPQERISRMLGMPQQIIFRLFSNYGNAAFFAKCWFINVLYCLKGYRKTWMTGTDDMGNCFAGKGWAWALFCFASAT